MKKLLLLLFVLLPFEASAQNFVDDGSKYDAYCDVECTILNKKTIRIIINNECYVINDNEGKPIEPKDSCKARLETRIFLGNYDRTLFYTFLYEKRDFQRQRDRSRPN